MTFGFAVEIEDVIAEYHSKTEQLEVVDAQSLAVLFELGNIIDWKSRCDKNSSTKCDSLQIFLRSFLCHCMA